MSSDQQYSRPPTQRPEDEHEGPIWKHPYMIYVLLTCILFGVIVLAGWLAWTNGWLPQR